MFHPISPPKMSNQTMNVSKISIALCFCTLFAFVSSDTEAMRDLVTDFPGQPKVGFRHFAGYVTVNETNGRALFYWFFEAMTESNVKPLVLWLNGGPGFSSVGFGETTEIGPFLVDNKGNSVKFNPYAWNKDEEDKTGWVDYAWSHAVISDETYQIIQRSCNFSSYLPYKDEECFHSIREVEKQYNEIDGYSLYTPKCLKNETFNASSVDSTRFKANLANSKMMPRLMGGYDPCLDEYTRLFYNRADVQKALHASDGVHLKNWSSCNQDKFWHYTELYPSVLPIYKKLINAGGLRIWVYSGDTDGVVPVLGTRYCINKLELPIKTAWRPWYHKKQVSGWVQEYEVLTFATFKGAGHTVPSFKPSESLAFFSAFLEGAPP